jgi:glycosyltransferase involved in cell wall biosynthesis
MDILTGNTPRDRISVCIIAKNEEAYIESCIASVLPVAWEIIVLDTGSTDRTKEIVRNMAQRQGNALSLPKQTSSSRSGRQGNGLNGSEIGRGDEFIKLYETTWHDDFSRARNESVQYASGDWILYIDADEVIEIESETKFFAYLGHFSKAEPIIIQSRLGYFHSRKTVDLRAVMFRNNTGIRFVQPIHEYLAHPDKTEKHIFCPYLNILIRRVRSEPEKETVIKKYIGLINNLITDGSFSESYPYLLLGDCYREINENDQALDNYFKAYSEGERIKKDKKSFFQLLIKIVELLLFFKKDYGQAYRFIDELAALSPDLPDAVFYKAYGKFRQGFYQEATELYQKILKLPKKSSNLNPLSLLSKGEVFIRDAKSELSRIYFSINDKLKGLKYLNLAFSNNFHIIDLSYFLIKYYLLEEDLAKVLFHFMETVGESQLTEIEKLKIISKLPHDSARYISSLITFLSQLEKFAFWLPQEEKQIKDKISALTDKLIRKQKDFPGSAPVCACLIIEGEEMFLENCLKSIQPLAQEIIFMDLGAGEAARKLADTYGRRIELKFQDDLNFVRKEFKQYTDSDWLLFISPDEELSEDSWQTLVKLVSDPGAAAFIYGKITEIEPGDKPWKSFYRPVLVNKNFDFSLFNPYLKQINFLDYKLVTNNQENLKLYSMKNLKSPAELKAEAGKTMERIEKIHLKNSINKFYLYKHGADTYAQLGEDDNAIELYYYSFNSFNESGLPEQSTFYFELLSDITSLFVIKYGKFKDALYFTRELLKIVPGFPDALFYQAYCEQYLGNYEKAMEIYESLLNYLNSDGLPVYPGSLEKELIPLILLEFSRCQIATGNELIAFYYLEKAFSVFPSSLLLNIHLTKYYLLEKNLPKAVYHFNKINFYLSESEKARFKNVIYSDNPLTNKETTLSLLTYLKSLNIWLDFELNQLDQIK